MRRVIAAVAVTISFVHGLIHLLGVVEGFGWADVEQLTAPIGAAMAVAWLAAAIAVVAAAVMMGARARGWWLVAGLAAIGSQAVVLTSWTDARAGTAANVLLLLAAVWGALADGPTSLRVRFRRLAADARATVTGDGRPSAALVTEDDLADLPGPVAEFLRVSGAVGRPRVVGIDATIHGRIRSDERSPWMRFTGRQVNTFGAAPTRVFWMDATMRGLPADVLHAYVGDAATMEVRAASVIPVVRSGGPEFTRAETVTILNDLCVFAPAALVDADVTWTGIDDRSARATFRCAGHTIKAVLVFDDRHRLVYFVSDDRLRAAAGGAGDVAQRWSTPITEHREVDGRTIGTAGAGRWHPPDGPAFDYLEIAVDELTFLEAAPAPTRSMSNRSGSANTDGSRFATRRLLE